MERKIHVIFSIAQLHRHDTLVLSAFGCGVFANAPHPTAAIFRSCLARGGHFFEVFARVQFAILDAEGEKNLQIFQEVLLGGENG